jgi:hypothetical protein
MTSMPDMYQLKKALRDIEVQRDHARACLADADLHEKLEKARWFPEGEDKERYIVHLEAKIAKRAERRVKELAEYGTYIRPGPWDDDLDDYQESSYTEEAGDGYYIRINRAYDGTYNGYAILPPDHPYANKHCDYFYQTEGMTRPPVVLTYSSSNMYGFYFMGGLKPRPDYSVFSAEFAFSSEKAEYGGYIKYDSMKKSCLELVEYFKRLKI